MIYQFLDFELDTDTQELREAGAATAIEPQVFDLLLFLIENRERLVSHDQLIENVWRGRIVADATIASRIRTVRKVVGDTGTEQAIIQTVPRRGFRFLAPISVPHTEPSHQPQTDTTSSGENQAYSLGAVAGPIMESEPLPLPDKPSIAVLPFENMSGDPEQEFFADGIAEDVITALSRFRSLFVIARNSSFTYKGRAVAIKEVAQDLGVRYVVEGSVRKVGNRVRITAQLIDAGSGNHLWADRFDGNLDDVFDLQDQITEQIVVAVAPEVESHERERASRKPPENLDAWELVQRGLSHFYSMDKSDNDEAIRLFRQAAARDPGFAAAHANLSYALWASMLLGYAEDRQSRMTSARVAAEKAVSLDANEPLGHFVLGRLLALAGEIEMAIGKAETAIAINPNFAWGHFGLGFVYLTCASVPEKALPHFDAALRLNPRDPLRWAPLMLKGSALRILGRYDEAVAVGRQACQFPDVGYMPYMHLSASLAEAGQIIEARAAAEKATERQPAFSINFHRDNFAGANETYLDSLLDSLRKAGVPE